MLRAGLLRIQDFLTVRARRKDLPRFRALLAIEPGSRLLDVGGGTGAFTEQFADGCDEIVVLEPDAGKVRYGGRRREGLRFVHGHAEEIPFPDGYFDRAMAIVSLHHFANHDRALEEIRRVLAPSGRLVIHELDPSRGPGRRSHSLEKVFGGGHSTFFEPGELTEKLEEHGFREVAVQRAPVGYSITATR